MKLLLAAFLALGVLSCSRSANEPRPVGNAETVAASNTGVVNDQEPEFEGYFAPTSQSEQYVTSVLALWDEFESCSANPRFATVGFARATTPCQGWQDRVSSLQDDRASGLESMRTGFDCLAGDLYSLSLAHVPPIDATDAELISFFKPKFEACRARLARWRAAGRPGR